jgi:hypothetical protein
VRTKGQRCVRDWIAVLPGRSSNEEQTVAGFAERPRMARHNRRDHKLIVGDEKIFWLIP